MTVSTEVRPQARAGTPWRRALLAALVVWLAGSLVQILVSALAYLPQHKAAPGQWEIARQWSMWDGSIYVTIALHGYGVGPGYPAFFPLYPMMIRMLPGDAYVSAFVLAHVFAFGALTMTYRLAEHEFGPAVAQRATIYLAVFPTSFFLFAPYNTSLYLLLATGTLYAARRGHFWLAGSLAALASATRLFGLLLGLSMAVEFLRQWRAGERRSKFAVLSLGLVPLGLVAYMVYSARVLGNPLAFSAAQHQWSRTYTVPGGAWVSGVSNAVTAEPFLGSASLANWLDTSLFLVAAVLLGLSVAGPWKLRRDQFYLVVYAAATLILLAATEVGGGRPMQSAPRYVLEATAIFLVLARVGAQPTVDRMFIVIGLALQTALATVFLAGGFMVA